MYAPERNVVRRTLMAKYYYPCLPWSLYNPYAGGFLSQDYYHATGSDHTGVDINANTGGDTDFDDRIYCITDGVVVEATSYPVWGNVVLVYHPGPKVWSQYAHLHTVWVPKGKQVKAGEVVGTMGKGANNKFISHLHFEIRYNLLPGNYWPSAVYSLSRRRARECIAANYVDGIKFLQKNNACEDLPE